MYDIMLARNVNAFIATRMAFAKSNPQVATHGAESALYDCLVIPPL